MRTLLAACALVLLLVADSLAARTIAGVVRAVYDGDTVLLATREESRLKVRLYGIDAPETRKPDKPGQPFGEVAKRTLMYKVMGRRVTAEVVDSDQYHRAVAVIRHAGRDINREMVAEGMAWAYRQYLHGPYASEYIGAEEGARARHKGLWRDANPQPPWEFRQGLKGGKRHGRHR
ncbi:MAG: thermonuclease family protein [Deltaproteobacteria bacterium]|nr:thermonuclease family protein [Deltaproteobacteria bacterium]